MIHEEKRKASRKNKDLTEEASGDISFTGIHVYKRSEIHVTALFDSFAEDKIDHAIVFSLVNLIWIPRLIHNSIRGLCVVEKPTPQLLVMGIDGMIEIYETSSENRISIEYVNLSEDGPNYSCWLTSFKKIGRHVYAAGLARQVYRRERTGQWNRIDKGIFVPREKVESAVGLWDIDGLREQDIYAVGYGGEIWHYNGNEWIQQESPTNVGLNCVRCVSDNEVYVCGMSGILIRGTAGQWQVIDQGATDQDFWGMVHFKNQLFLSGDEGIFVLEGDELKQVDMGTEEEFTTSYLDAKDGAIWSVGEKHIACSVDGINWSEVEAPL